MAVTVGEVMPRDVPILLPQRTPSEYTAGEIVRALENYPDLAECAYCLMAVPVFRELLDGGTVTPGERWDALPVEPPPSPTNRPFDGFALVRIKADVDMAIDSLPRPLRELANLYWRHRAPEDVILQKLPVKRREFYKMIGRAKSLIVAVLMA